MTHVCERMPYDDHSINDECAEADTVIEAACAACVVGWLTKADEAEKLSLRTFKESAKDVPKYSVESSARG